MAPELIGAAGILGVLVLLTLRVPIGFSLIGVASVCTFLTYAWPPDQAFSFAGFRPALGLIISNAFDFIHSYQLSMVPLFIAAGHLAFHTRITTEIYDSARVLVSRLPGGLAIASLLGCGGFSAITGSSVACASSMARICVPEMLRFGYSQQLAASSVAVGGTLGALIPPSLLFIIYGMFTETSVSKLFLAGIVPGLISLVAYIAVVFVWSRLRPRDAPVPELRFTVAERRVAVAKAWPAIALIGLITGGIYGGVLTATEVAAIAFVAMLLFGVLSKRLSWATFSASMIETAQQTASLFLIAVGARIFVSFIALTDVTEALIGTVEAAGLSNGLMLLCIVFLYLVLGMFLDPIGSLLLTLPFVVPLIETMGYELIWFGVVVVKLLELGLITPPVGLNVFVIKSVLYKEVEVHTVFFGVAKFMIADLLVLLLLILFPALSLFLPGRVA